jgi:hypothetical protein
MRKILGEIHDALSGNRFTPQTLQPRKGAWPQQGFTPFNVDEELR